MLACSLVLATGYIAPARPIAQPLHLGRARAAAARLQSPSLQADDGPLASAQTAYTIFQASQAEGVGFKQAVADALAGEYDRDAITAEVQAAANASPLALFRVATCVLPQPWAYAYTSASYTAHTCGAWQLGPYEVCAPDTGLDLSHRTCRALWRPGPLHVGLEPCVQESAQVPPACLKSVAPSWQRRSHPCDLGLARLVLGGALYSGGAAVPLGA